jgi:hypothetical protein
MTFSGRGFSTPRITTIATASGVTLRVDCDERPETWAEMHMTALDVVMLMVRINEVAAAEPFPAAEPELGGEGG